ncbi:MAG: glycosyltransferase family 4 protein [Ruminococcus sp.]|nr:glycosyltransferase family 4 protein [Ruminococcus sp.]
MIITFFSYFMNHHQLPLCEELKKNSDEFYFVATAPIPEDRLQMGYEDLNTAYDFVLRSYDGSTSEERIAELLEESDIVIFGNSPVRYVEHRMKFNKPSFLYNERCFKKGTWRRYIPKIRNLIKRRVLNFKDKNLYVLCASGFASADLKLMGFSEEKCLKWGYFPQVNAPKPHRHQGKKPVRILWTGRLIDWKHPDDALQAAVNLHRQGIDFTLDFIGIGKMERRLKAVAKNHKLQEKVRFQGSMSPSEVLENMQKADIFLMTSDFNEGWGAVVNESMGSGCAVLASSAVGSVPFLINDKQNGLIYQYGNKEDFEAKLRILSEDAELRKKLGENAFNTIKNDYNARVAAYRLVEFVRNGCRLNETYESGPMTKAPVLENRWYNV